MKNKVIILTFKIDSWNICTSRRISLYNESTYFWTVYTCFLSQGNFWDIMISFLWNQIMIFSSRTIFLRMFRSFCIFADKRLHTFIESPIIFIIQRLSTGKSIKITIYNSWDWYWIKNIFYHSSTNYQCNLNFILK